MFVVEGIGHAMLIQCGKCGRIWWHHVSRSTIRCPKCRRELPVSSATPKFWTRVSDDKYEGPANP